MGEEKCSICGMRVRNMKVHIKLNHKKILFGFTGLHPPQQCTKSSKPDKQTPVIEKRIPKIHPVQQPELTPFVDCGKKEMITNISDENLKLLKYMMAFHEVTPIDIITWDKEERM